MYHKVEYEIHTSKLATIVSMLQSSIWVCFAVFFPIFNIPSFICLICDVEAVVIGTLFGVLGVLSFVVSILFCIFVDAQKIDNYMLRKRKKRKDKRSIKEVKQVYESTIGAIQKARDTLYTVYQAHGVVLPEEKLLETTTAIMDATSNEEMLSIMFGNIPTDPPTVDKFILYTTLFIEKYTSLFCPDDNIKRLLNRASDEIKTIDIIGVNIAYKRQKECSNDGDLFRFNYELIAIAIVFDTLEDNKHLYPVSCECMLKSMRFYADKAGYTKVS